MPFTLNDSFDDFAREHRLPDCAVSYLSRAGAWSARTSKSGFVPSTMHAEFSCDTDQAVRALLAAGALRRVKAGVRIAESGHWTLVNARDVTRDAEREEAGAERRRELERARKQRQRDRERAGREERMSAGVTPMSHVTGADVTQKKTGKRKKPQVSGNDVTRDISVTSRVTPGPSRGRARGLDFDFNQRGESQVSQSGVSDAGAREDEPAPGSPEFRLQVIAEFAGATGDEIDDATADSLAAEVLGKATEPVPHPLGYVRRAILKERNPQGRWLPKQAARTAFAEPPPHCGDPLCSPRTRRREHPETGADDGPCPKCSPATRKVS